MIGALAVATSVAAEALAVYVAAELFASGQSGDETTVNALAFVLAGLAAYGLPRFLDTRHAGRRAGFAITVLTAFILIHGAVRIAFAGDLAIWSFQWAVDFVEKADTSSDGGGRAILAVALLAALWARESWRATDEVDLELATRTIALPFGVVLFCVLAGSGTERAGVIARGGAAFFAVAVISLALAQLALSGATFGAIRAGSTTAFLLFATAAGSLASVLLIGVLFGLIGDQLFDVLGAVLTVLLTALLVPPFWLMEQLFSLLFSGAQFPQFQVPEIEQAPAEQHEGESRSFVQNVALFGGRSIALVLALGLVAGLVWFVTRYARRRGPGGLPPPERAGAGGLGEDLRAGLRGLFTGRRRSASLQGVAALYQDVLHSAAGRGQPRPDADTPHEFAPALRSTFATPVTDEITAAYEEAAYAGREPGPATLSALERRWRDLR